MHRPAKPNGAAIVICPGGGYRMKMIGSEGHGIAEWLNKHGITGVVLDYRLPDGRAFVPLLDAQRAIRTVRAHAKEWELDPRGSASWVFLPADTSRRRPTRTLTKAVQPRSIRSTA